MLARCKSSALQKLIFRAELKSNGWSMPWPNWEQKHFSKCAEKSMTTF